MSILIKDMNIPAHCGECPIDTNGCRLWENFGARWERRHPGCPLAEIPTPHGRLIDEDELMTKISTMMQEPDYQHEGENWMVGLIMARDAIDDAPTVIEAEGNEG